MALWEHPHILVHLGVRLGKMQFDPCCSIGARHCRAPPGTNIQTAQTYQQIPVLLKSATHSKCSSPKHLCLVLHCLCCTLFCLPCASQIGFPLQYNQYPLLRALWNIRFLATVVANKVLPFLVSPPLFLMIQDPQQSYSSVLAATERSRRVLYVLAAALVAGIAWLLQKVFLRAAGAA